MQADLMVTVARPEWFYFACAFWLGMVVGIALMRLAAYIGRVLRRERKYLDGQHRS